MANNVLTGVVQITAPGAAAVFQGVADNAKKTETALKSSSLSVSKFGDTLETLKAKLGARQSFLNVEKDVAKIAILNSEIKVLQTEISRINNIGSKGFDQFGNAAATMGTKLGGVGSAAGKAFSGLRQIAYILPGIGIAGIIGGLSEMVIGLFNTGKQSEETAKALKELIKPIEDIRDAAAAGTAEELAKVQVLSAAVLDQTKSYGQRNAALNQLKEINKSYFGDLTLEESKLGLVKTATEEYTKAIISQAVIKAFSDEIGKVSVELSKQEKAYNKAGEEVEKYKKIQGSVKGTIAGTALPVISPEGIKGTIDATAAFEKQGKVINSLRGQMFELRQAIKEAVDQSLDLKPLTDIKTPKSPVIKIKPYVDPYEFIKGVEDFNKSNRIAIKVKVVPDLNNEDKTNGFYNEIKEKKIDLSVPVKFKLVTPNIDNSGLIKAAAKLTADFNNALQVGLASGFEALGEGIGNALSGKDFGTQIFQVFGSLFSSIGKALIEFGIIRKGIEQIFKNPLIPAVIPIALGIAAVAAGQLFKNIKGARALGGNVGAGDEYLVGERGPEIFRPNTGGRIIPNNQIGTGSSRQQGGLMVQVAGSTTVKGQDLLIAFTLANQSKLRLQ